MTISLLWRHNQVLLNVGRQLNDVSQVIAIMLVIMMIGIAVDGFIFKKLEDKVMSRWGLR